MKNKLSFVVLLLLSMALFSDGPHFQLISKAMDITDNSYVVGRVEENFDTGTYKEVFAKQNTDGSGYIKSASNLSIGATNVNSSLISGTKKVAVIKANFNDLKTSQPSDSTMSNLINNNINQYFSDVSFGKAGYTGTGVFGWYTINMTSNCDTWNAQNPSGDYFLEVAKSAISAADNDINFNNFDQVMVTVPKTCNLGAIGWYPPGPTVVTGEGSKQILLTLFNTDYWTNTNYGVQVIAHEFGHNFNAHHANGLECGSSQISGSCTSTPYGDPTDVMGGDVDWKFISSYGNFEKELFGWLGTSNVQVVDKSGDYYINPIDQYSSGVQFLKIVRPGQSSYLTIENRTNSGADINYPAVNINGGNIKIVPIAPAVSETNLIDSTPHVNTNDTESRRDFNDATFAYGSTFTDISGVKINVISKTGNVLKVHVDYLTPTPSPTPYVPGKIFSDVPATHPFVTSIEKLYLNGYTAGCASNPLKFCPDTVLDRAQAAVFIIRGNFGSTFTPAPVAHIFKDDWSKVPWAEVWAEAMYKYGLSAGCLTNPLSYCPLDKLPRYQVAVFAVRLKRGNSFIPPAAKGTVFADMTNTSFYGTAWSEQAYADGLIAACGTQNGKPLFCPGTLVTRGLAADIIVKAKNLK